MDAPRRRPTGRASTQTRIDVFERDGYRCVDCGRRAPRLPESLLEADHDTEVADGGSDDLGNYVTRCLTHHDAKTKERAMARAQTPQARTQGTRATRAAQTAQLPDRPEALPHVRAAVLFAFTGALMYGVQRLLNGGHERLVVVVTVLVVAVVVGLYVARWVGWRRATEAQRVYERLAKVAGLGNAHRRLNFKVHTWRGFEPTAVTLVYGPTFDTADDYAWDKLAAAYGDAIGVLPAQVAIARKSRGRAHLSIANPDDARAHNDDDARWDDVEEPVESARAPERADAISERVRDALAGVLGDDCDVTIDAWWGNGEPRAGSIVYPSRATRAARDARADLPRVMAAAFPPVSEHGLWVFDWHPAQDRFGFRDVPDDLAPVVPLAPVDAGLDLRAGPVIGVTEHGTPWRQPLLEDHVLVAGMTGAGKGSVLWGIIRALRPFIADGRCLLYVSDPKGGMEFTQVKPIAHRFTLKDGTAEMLTEAVEDMQAQARRLASAGARKLETPTRENPLRVIIVDELANFAGDKDVAALMATLLQQGRAVGTVVIGALQDARVKSIDNRDLFKSTIALRLRSRGAADMVLGPGMRAAGAVCDLVPKALPGVGYVVTEETPDPVRVRAAFVPDEEIARIVAVEATPPAHTARATGEQYAIEPAQPAPRTERAPRAPVPVEEPAQRKGKAVRARTLLGGFPDGARALLPDDKDEALLLEAEDEGDDRVALTYRYDGETSERVYSFDGGDIVVLLA